jgi:hypothetical protein
MNPEIIFDISPDFISPFYPKRGETVELSLMARGELDEILLQGMFAGTSRTLRFEKGDDLGGGWHRYALTLSFLKPGCTSTWYTGRGTSTVTFPRPESPPTPRRNAPAGCCCSISKPPSGSQTACSTRYFRTASGRETPR